MKITDMPWIRTGIVEVMNLGRAYDIMCAPCERGAHFPLDIPVEMLADHFEQFAVAHRCCGAGDTAEAHRPVRQ